MTPSQALTILRAYECGGPCTEDVFRATGLAMRLQHHAKAQREAWAIIYKRLSAETRKRIK